MNYKETTEYLFSMLPMYQKQGKTAIKKDLTNIRKLCKALDDPQHMFKSIHVGGTNGKGTVSHLIAAALQKCGNNVGMYTSPHYVDFRERIKINGIYIPENDVIEFTKFIQKHIEEIRPSFFEVSVAMAFYYFAQCKVDYAVVEVGLGGLLDSTNIIHPELSVITNIGMDHMDYLGDTIPLIATQKAGIIKPRVPAIIGEYDSDSAPVFIHKASDSDTEIQFADQQWEVAEGNENIRIFKNTELVYSLKPNGPFHHKNVITAITAVLQLNLPLTTDQLTDALDNFVMTTAYQGRWQKMGSGPDIIFDSGHNIHAMKKTISYLNDQEYQNIHFVLGFVKDKDVSNMLNLLPKTGKYYFSKPSIFRGAQVESYQETLDEMGIIYESYLSVKSGFEAAQRSAANDDLIFVGGSSFVVGEMLEYLS